MSSNAVRSELVAAAGACSRRRAIISSSRTADFVSRAHADLFLLHGSYQLSAWGKNNTYIRRDEQWVRLSMGRQNAIALRPGDIIRIDAYQFRYNSATPAFGAWWRKTQAASEDLANMAAESGERSATALCGPSGKAGLSEPSGVPRETKVKPYDDSGAPARYPLPRTATKAKSPVDFGVGEADMGNPSGALEVKSGQADAQRTPTKAKPSLENNPTSACPVCDKIVPDEYMTMWSKYRVCTECRTYILTSASSDQIRDLIARLQALSGKQAPS